MTEKKDRHIFFKIFRIIFPIWLIFALFILSIFFIFAPALKQNLMAQKKETIKSLVDSSCKLFAGYQARVEKGELNLYEAQARAIDHIRNLRYGAENKDYFWINDMHPFMVMHPYRPDLEGRDLTLFMDTHGNHLFMEMVQTVMQDGGGYVNYFWQWKDAPHKVVPKISYVKGFAPWGWILGTGIYTQDVKSEINLVLKKLSIISGIIMFIMMGISIYLTMQTIRIEKERRKSAGNLRKSEQFHRRFIEDAPIAMCNFNMKGQFTYLNRKFGSLTGYEKENWLNRSYHEIVHPDDLAMVQEIMARKIKGELSPDAFEARLINNEGQAVWVRINTELIVEDGKASRNIVGIQSFVEDITHQKEAEFALKSSEGRLKAILEANPEPMVVYDLQGHPQYLNPAFIDVFGWSLKDLKGRTIPFVPEDQQEILFKKIEALFKTGQVLSFETRRLTKDHRCLDVLISAALIKTLEDDSSGMVVNLTDITEKKKLEAHYKQAQKMESIGTLTGGIAHDFNNILNVILGNTELALDDIPRDNPAYESLKDIRTAGSRAADIVRQLLSFSRKSDQAFKPISLSYVVNDSLNLLRSLIPANVEVEKHFEARDDTILADPVQINQVMMNLCVNASQEMEKKGGILTISLDNFYLNQDKLRDNIDLTSGDYVRMLVSDTGPGIDPANLDRIFDPYFTTKEIGKGSGMGLSVVHGIVKNHCGAIKVSSRTGSGTTFRLLFPLIKEKPEAVSDKKDPVPHGSETILFVDDEQSITDMGKVILERLGYQVEICLDPLDAIRLFESDPGRFDLAITDMTMPGMTGDKLAEQLIKIRPDIPVIICTGYSAVMDEDKAKKIGIAGYLQKPVNISTLSTAIRKALGTA